MVKDEPCDDTYPGEEGSATGTKEDEGICDICLDGESLEDNPIVFCDGCDLAVHKYCYGNPLVNGIPDDEWLCELCEHKPKNVKCALCPLRTGAMKRTTDWRWAHIACALWIPEVFFLSGDGREPIDYLRIRDERWKQTCIYCNESGTDVGCCIDCSENKCGATFHVSCGLKNNVYLEYKTASSKEQTDIIVSFCARHAVAAKKKANWKMRFYSKA